MDKYGDATENNKKFTLSLIVRGSACFAKSSCNKFAKSELANHDFVYVLDKLKRTPGLQNQSKSIKIMIWLIAGAKS